jgi:ribosomally synthesized peptide (two-chain TOMM family)
MNTIQLTEFRRIYLRAIAEAWADPNGFGKQFTGDNPISALKDRFGYVWPWSKACELQIARADEEYRWSGDAWVWSKELMEGLTIRLPLTPKCFVALPGNDSVLRDLAPEDYAMALGDYYRQRPSLFHDDWGQEHDQHGARSHAQEEGGGVDLRAARREVQHPSRREQGRALGAHRREGEQQSQESIGFRSGPPADGFITDERTFADFTIALLGVMAKAWSDDEFKRALQRDAVSALQTIRGYTVPWDMSISVEDDGRARWHRPGSPPDKDHQSYWDALQPHRLKLYLPTKPSSVASEPVALATYSATGAAYPFTCTS